MNNEPQYSKYALLAIKRHMNPRILVDPVENADGSCTIVFHKEKLEGWCEWWKEREHFVIMGDWLKKWYVLRNVVVGDDRVTVTIEPYSKGEIDDPS